MKKEKVIAVIKEYTIFILVAFFVSASLIQASLIPTGSMETTIKVGDFLLVNRLAYDFYTPRNIPHTNVKLPYFEIALNDGPELGDIVVFEFPGYDGSLEYEKYESWVKRCVGTPGDTVLIRDRILFVNNREFKIPSHIHYENLNSLPLGSGTYSSNPTFPQNAKWTNEDNFGEIVVPKKGDIVKLNSENYYLYETLINRELGSKALSLQNGEVFLDCKTIEKYTIQKDYYFMVGDNRNDSLDSRYWGFVPRDRVLGTPFFVFFSWDSSIPFSEFFNLLSSIRLDRIGKIL